MPVETPTYISDLNSSYPLATDPVGQGAAHMRAIKGAVKATFPNIDGAITGTPESINAAADLQPSGPGEVVVPALADVGSRIKLTGLTGTLHYLIRNLASALRLTKSDGTTETDLLSLNGFGDLSVLRNVSATAYYCGTTPISFVGEVRMFAGAVVDIPTGWALCDGNNGTPNLTNRFVIGAGDSYAVNATGGATGAVLAEGNLPAHKHGIVDVAHSHTITDPGHTHGITDPGHSHTKQAGYNFNNIAVQIYANTTAINSGTLTTNSATTGITVNSATTGITAANAAYTGISETTNTGSGTAFSILNPYYALCFVMRVA